MKKLDYAPAWYKIGEAYGTPFEERTERQKFIAGKRALCLSMSRLNKKIYLVGPFNRLKKDMRIRPKDSMCHHEWWPYTSEYDQARSDFAILMWALGNAGFQDLLDYAAGEGKYANT